MTSKHKIQQQKKEKGSKKVAIYVIVAVVLAIGAYSYISTRDKGPGQYDDFAKCLTEKGAVMYGAYWCSHCKAQKEEFGNSFQYVNYVECEEKKEVCLRAGIEGYPTWQFADGSEQSGQISLPSLAARTGCSLYN